MPVSFIERKRSSSTLHVRANVDDVIRCADELGLTVKALRKAQQRAMRKLGVWLAGKTIKEVSKEKQITMRALRQRFRVYQDKRFNDLYVKAWFGLDPLTYSRVGGIRQTKKGVRAGKHFVEGAFIAAPKLFGQKAAADVWMRKGKERLPIYKPRLDIADSIDVALNKVFPGASARLAVLVEHEMRYELQRVAKVK